MRRKAVITFNCAVLFITLGLLWKRSKSKKSDELRVNDRGQTYGPDILDADLIAVVSDSGEPGYIYQSDFENIEAKKLEAASQHMLNVVLKVYKDDGYTQIGTFTLN